MITIEPTNFEAELSAPTLTRFLNRARTAIGLRGAVDVLLTTDQTVRQLNRSFRGKDKPTDVLSFPAPQAFASKHAGDLAISLDTAARQAKAFAHPTQDEVKILILHGLLHLAGEDHETDKGEMATREAALRHELKLPNTLIERTTQTTKKSRTSAQKTNQKTSRTRPKPSQSNKKSSTRGGK
jgi:probable rRNA maturation factor